MKRYHDHSNSSKGHLIGAGLKFLSLVHQHQGGKHSSMQADMMLEEELRLLHLDLHAAGREACSSLESIILFILFEIPWIVYICECLWLIYKAVTKGTKYVSKL